MTTKTLEYQSAKNNVIEDVDASAQLTGSVSDEVVSFSLQFAYEEDINFYLSAEDYPVLADIWDNDDDAIFDTL